MSLVENIISQISTKNLGGITKPQGFDMNDDAFEKILKGMGENANNVLNEKLQTLGNLGQPSGMIIEPFDKTANASSPIKPVEESTEPFQIKDVDLGNNYFSNLLKNAPKEHKSILNVAQKYASNAYNIFGKNLVEDLADFAKDVTSML